MNYSPITEGDTDGGQGQLEYSFPEGASIDEAIDDLALLLTASRLSSFNRGLIRGAIENEYYTGDKAKATRVAQQLVMTTPEFHSWGSLHSNSGSIRQHEGYTQAPSGGYKSVVFFFLEGGADSFNLIVPTGGCTTKDMYKEYAKARGQLAVSKESLLPINAQNQICSSFGIHPNLPILQQLYNDDDASFFLNMGILSQPLKKTDDWITKSKIRLFAHNHMSREQLALDPHDQNPGTGVGGRLLDMLKKNGHQTSGNTVDGSSLLNVGDSYYSNPPATINTGTVSTIDEVSSLGEGEMLNLIKQLNGNGAGSNSMFGETWSQKLSQSLFEYETSLEIDAAIQNGDFNMDGYKAKGEVANQFKATAQYMKSRHLRKVDREVYVVSQGGYDMHASLKDLPNRFQEANNALATFVNELKGQGIWDDTVIIMVRLLYSFQKIFFSI